MSTKNQKRLSLFSALLAGFFLLIAVGAHQNFAKKKLLSYEGDNIEVSIDAEGDNDWNQPFTLVLTPGGFIFVDAQEELETHKLDYRDHSYKKLSEGRLYILFHQLRSHIG